MNNEEENILEFINNVKNRKSMQEQDEVVISARETEVLKLIAAGYSNKEIAESLSISQRTVDGHKSNLLIKTSSKNIVVLLKWALNRKIISF